MTRYAHVDGDLRPLDQASVPVTDRGFLYGDAAFETMRVYGGRAFAWTAHLDRLEDTCDVLGMEHGYSREELRARMDETLQANACSDAYVRLAISRGTQPGRLTPMRDVNATVVIIVESLPRGGMEGTRTWDEPATIAIVDTERIPNAALPARAKTHNYLNGILARLEVRNRDVDEAIMCDASGALTEGATSNLFLVEDGTLRTPNVDAGPVLPGITRATVLDLATELDVPTEETVLYPRDVRRADEVFLTNSTAEIRPVDAVDDLSYRTGPVTGRLLDAFDRRIETRCYDTP